MPGEVAHVAIEVAKVAAKVEKTVEKTAEKAAEVGKKLQKDTAKFNIDRRIDLNSDQQNDTLKDPTVRFVANKGKEIPKVLDKKLLPDIKALIDKGINKEVLSEAFVDENGIVKIPTLNDKLVDMKHPETKVPFSRKIIDVGGKLIEGVFPEFKSFFDVQLPEDLWKASDYKQFKECTKQLSDEIDKNPLLRLKFSPRDIAKIQNGILPDRFTWHHNETPGKMQLVDTKTHSNTNHTGGKAIWGGER